MKSKNIPFIAAAVLLFAMACMCSDTATPSVPTVEVPTIVIEEAPTIEEQQPSSSGYITDVILARDVEGEEKSPVDPTTVFGTDSIIHAVVKIEDSPAGTNYSAEFYVVDVGSAADPGSLITSTDLEADGTRYIDFNLTPTTSWPVGTYRVDILVNGVLDQSVEYTVE
jgi:hypothetical protein